MQVSYVYLGRADARACDGPFPSSVVVTFFPPISVERVRLHTYPEYVCKIVSSGDCVFLYTNIYSLLLKRVSGHGCVNWLCVYNVVHHLVCLFVFSS